MPIEARVIRLIPVVVWILTVLVDKYAWFTPRLAIPLPIHPNAPRPQTSLIPSLVRAFTSLCVPRRLASCAADYVNLCMMEASSVGVKAEVVASAVAGTLVGACLFPGLWPWIWLSFKDLPCAPRHDIRAEMNVHGDEGLGAVNHNVDLDDAYPPEVVYLSTADGYGMAMMGFRCATSGSVLLLVRVLGVTMMDTIVLCVSRLRRLTPVTRLQSSELTSHVGYVASLSSSWALHGSRVLYFATGYGLGKLWARRESVAIFLSQVPLLGSIFEASLPLPVPAALLEADLEFSGECVVLRFPVGKAGDKTGTVVVPATVICPIFRRLMRNPVQTVDGYIYDREGILAWFSMHQTSPMTNVKLENCDVQPHHESRLSIKKAICDYHQATSTG